jgi:hypothetical protein
MISVLASSVGDHGFKHRSGQTNVYKLVLVASLYHGENKLIFNEMMMRSALY